MRILILSFLLNLTFTVSFSAYGAYQCAGLFSDQSSALYEKSKKLQDNLILRQYGKGYNDLILRLKNDKNSAATQRSLEILNSDQLAYTMLAPSGVRDRIAADGFKNIHESPVSRGLDDRDIRDSVEASQLGMTHSQYANLPANVKPKYGFLKPRMNSEFQLIIPDHYGDDIFVFKKSSLRHRVTFTLSDSLNYNLSKEAWEDGHNSDPDFTLNDSQFNRGEVTEPKSIFDAFFPVEYLPLASAYVEFDKGYMRINPSGNSYQKGYRDQTVIKEYNLPAKMYGSDYLELQFWGELDLSHVESFTFRNKPPSGAFLSALKKHKIKIYDGRNLKNPSNRFDQKLVEEWNEALESGIEYEMVDKFSGRWTKPVKDLLDQEANQQEFRTAGGSTGGRWVKDAEGNSWFSKTDVLHPELQTSAEVISAYIYRAMGYNVPVTHKLKIGSRYYSFSKDIGAATKSSNLAKFKTPQERILRVVAAYLKDWDRLGNPENNRVLPDGSLVLIDFGGTLGSRARGEFKPGPVVSEAIGAFDSGSQKDIYRSFTVNAAKNHPWMNITKQDLAMAIVLFEKLTNSYLYDAVSSANYSSAKDAQYMFETLKNRRDNLIAELKEML